MVLLILEKGRSQANSNWLYEVDGEMFPMCSQLGFKPIPECATLDSRVSDQGRICDFVY